MRSLLAAMLVLTAGCSSTAQPVPEEVTGPITSIERAGGEIIAFTVEENNSYRIRTDPTRDYGFDLEHLVEHRTTGQPVRVTIEERDGSAVAVDILDA